MKIGEEAQLNMTRAQKDTPAADQHNESGNFVNPIAEKVPRNCVLEDTGENSMDQEKSWMGPHSQRVGYCRCAFL